MAGLALLLAAGVLTACGGSAGAAPVAVVGPSPEYHGTWLQEPIPEPDVTLTDTSGKPFNLRKGTAGRLTLVYFGYTHCPDICPTTMADLAAALRSLDEPDRDRISVVFITTDPGRDTPKVIKSWLRSFDPSFVGLTGDFATISAAARSVGIAVEPPASTSGDYEVTHGAEVIAFDGADQGRVIFSSGTTPADYATDLRKMLGPGPTPAAGTQEPAS